MSHRSDGKRSWFFSSHALSRRVRRLRHAHRPGHEQLERRALLSSVPNDASVRDLGPIGPEPAVAADDSETNIVTAPVLEATPTVFQIVSAAPLAADLAGRLQGSIDIARATLDAAFAGPGLNSILAESFGRDVADTAAFQGAVAQLRDAWQRGEIVVDVELRSAAELNGHPAAYAADGADGTERIYVNRDWLLAVDDTSRAAGVLLEEFGHVTPSPNLDPGLVRESSCPYWGLKGFSDEEATQCGADRGLASAG
jgi:hypothetical protein